MNGDDKEAIGSQDTTDIDWLPWASVGVYGLLWASMHFYGLLWTKGQRDGRMVGQREGWTDRQNSVRLEESKNGRV